MLYANPFIEWFFICEFCGGGFKREFNSQMNYIFK